MKSSFICEEARESEVRRAGNAVGIISSTGAIGVGGERAGEPESWRHDGKGPAVARLCGADHRTISLFAGGE